MIITELALNLRLIDFIYGRFLTLQALAQAYNESPFYDGCQRNAIAT